MEFHGGDKIGGEFWDDLEVVFDIAEVERATSVGLVAVLFTELGRDDAVLSFVEFFDDDLSFTGRCILSLVVRNLQDIHDHIIVTLDVLGVGFGVFDVGTLAELGLVGMVGGGDITSEEILILGLGIFRVRVLVLLLVGVLLVLVLLLELLILVHLI